MGSVPDEKYLDPRQMEIRLNRYSEFSRMNSRYLDWQLEQFRPFLGERILEIGCGIGGILERLPPCSLIQSIDVDEDVLNAAKKRFVFRAECRFELLDLSSCDEEHLAEMKCLRFDTVIAINVLEHIQVDATVLRRAEHLLVPGGYLLLLVPAHQCLYGQYDRLDGHFRRYSLKSLRTIVSHTSFEVRRMSYFNMAGAIGWWVHYRLLGRNMHGTGQFGLMNRLIPLMRRAERIASPPFGLSIVSVLRRPL